MPAIAHPNLHSWNLPPAEAIQLQKDLAGRLISDRQLNPADLHTVAGVDVSVKNGVSRAAVVVLSFPDLQRLEVSKAEIPTPFPYVPGLLSFREGEVILHAYEKLAHTPDVLIFDGQGQAHPRRLGIAAHLGLWLERPTIGCGKTRFIGDYGDVPQEKGSYAPLLDQDECIGVVLRTRTGVKPVFISPGHLCDLDSALKIALICTPQYRLPEPIRAADHEAGLPD